MRYMVALVLAAAVPVAAAATPAVSGPRTGLHGFVTRGLVTPVCEIGVPCEVRAVGVRLTFTRSDGRKAQALTRERGFYRIVLPAGRYSVSVSRRLGKPRPGRVWVRPGLDARFDLYIDTGIQ